jgi:hypothetical protein
VLSVGKVRRASGTLGALFVAWVIDEDVFLCGGVVFCETPPLRLLLELSPLEFALPA